MFALWFGAKEWVVRFVPEGRRVWALAFALFFCSPIAALVGWTGWGGIATRFDFDFLSGELTTNNYLWGYLFTAIAVGLMPLGLLAQERGRTGVAAAIGLIVAWFQPWQGATYLLVLCGAEVLTRRAFGRLAVVVAATAAPLVYYLALSRLDDSWRLAGEANDFGLWPWWVTVIGLAPLVLPALTGLRHTAGDLGGWMLRLWPLASLVVLFQPFGTFPAHALQGITLPLVTLAFVGVGATAGRAWLIGALVLLVVPGTVYRVDELRKAVNAGRQPFFLTDGEYRGAEVPGPRAAARAACSRPCTRACWCRRGRSGRRGSAPGRGRRASTRACRRPSSSSRRGSGVRRPSGWCASRARATCSPTATAAPTSASCIARVVTRERRFGCATVWEVRA